MTDSVEIPIADVGFWLPLCRTQRVFPGDYDYDWQPKIATSAFGSDFYRAMLRRAQLCHSMSSVCDVQVPLWHRLEFFENNFTAEYLKASAQADPNMGDLAQREHLQN